MHINVCISICTYTSTVHLYLQLSTCTSVFHFMWKYFISCFCEQIKYYSFRSLLSTLLFLKSVFVHFIVRFLSSRCFSVCVCLLSSSACQSPGMKGATGNIWLITHRLSSLLRHSAFEGTDLSITETFPAVWLWDLRRAGCDLISVQSVVMHVEPSRSVCLSISCILRLFSAYRPTPATLTGHVTCQSHVVLLQQPDATFSV